MVSLLSLSTCSNHLRISNPKQALSNTHIQETSSQPLSCLLLTVTTVATTATQPIPSTELPLHMIPSTGPHRHTIIKFLLNMIPSTGFHRHTISKLRLHTNNRQHPIHIMIRNPSSMTMPPQWGKSNTALSISLADLFQSSLTLLRRWSNTRLRGRARPARCPGRCSWWRLHRPQDLSCLPWDRRRCHCGLTY